MKKWLSILGAIGLTATSTTSLISCEKPNNNENGGNKPEPTPKPQQPPKNSNWKLVDINWQKDRYKFENEFKKLNNKWCFFIESDTYGFNKYLAKNNDNNIKQVNEWHWILILNNGNYVAYFDASKIKLIYCWDGVGEPQTPTINSNTGEIINWKG
ncbi:MAG: lipoprotein [Spiroplasma phoeniceum]|nr:MAG: lipoprotein [Spiroplasma phoeniceum]UZQ33348.1 MAG: lipoprotein [Spiroplasma phoeniceum]